MKIPFLSKISVLLPLLITACAPAAQTSSSIPIVVQLGSVHQAVYGGFYAADQNGDYARAGLAVSFIEGTPSTDLVAPLMDNTAQFGIMGASSIISERAAGKPIRALATILRRDPVAFFSLADSGIVHLEDFVGKKIYASARLLPRLKAMLTTAHIGFDKITVVSTGDATALYNGGVDVSSGLITSTVLSARQAGHAVNIIYPDDYGVHFYSNTIYASEDYITAHPDIVTRFLKATLDGWAEAVETPQAIGPMVAHYNPKADAAFESASMAASIPYINTGEDHIGWMKASVWEGMLQAMRAEDEVTSPVNIDDVYTMQFLQQIYGENAS